MAIGNLVLSLIHYLNKNSLGKKIYPISNKLRTFTLKNDLDVLLIHNPSFKDSALMLTVDAGSIYDPCEIPGLAHLVEHLIFSGSENFNSNSQWWNFQKKKGGTYNGITALEKMNFFSQIADENFEESLNYLLSAITKPLFREEDCLREIELIEHETRIKNSEINSKIMNLTSFLTDEKFYESKFIGGNIKTLKVIGIENEVKKFHSSYFKANRMKLVIKSKFSLDYLEKIAEKFECIQTELENESNPHIERNKENEIDSLLNKNVDIKFKEDYRGKIIKYVGIKNNFVANLYFFFPSHLYGYTSIHLDYLIESISQQLEQILLKNPFVKSFLINQANCRRKNVLTILLELTEENYKKVNIVVSTIYEYFRQLKPNENLFNDVKMNSIAKRQQFMNESEVVKNYSDYLFLYSNHELGEFESRVQYNEQIFKDIFTRLANIKNWTVFISTNDSNLPNYTPFKECNFGKPIPIAIELSAQNFYKNNKLQEYKPLSKIKIESAADKIDLQEIKAEISHLQLEFGEYTLVYDKSFLDQYCEITISFISPGNEWKNHSNDLFNYALSDKIPALCVKKKIDAQLKIQKFHLFENNLVVKIKKEQLTEFLEILTDQLKNFKLNDSEIKKAKKIEVRELKSFLNSSKKSELIDFSKYILPYIIKQNGVCLGFQINQNSSAQFNENYYLMITAIGNITKKEVLEVYESLKSTGTRENYDNLAFENIEFRIENEKSPDNSLTIAYRISATSKLKEFAIANLLKMIFHGFIYEFLECKNSFSYSNQVNYTYVRQQAFLIISIRTLKNTNLIKDKIKEMMGNYYENINKISEDDLESFKKTTCQMFEWKIKTHESLSFFALLTSLIGIYDCNLQKVVKEAINSITIEELRNLHDNFSVNPIVIHGINEI